MFLQANKVPKSRLFLHLFLSAFTSNSCEGMSLLNLHNNTLQFFKTPQYLHYKAGEHGRCMIVKLGLMSCHGRNGVYITSCFVVNCCFLAAPCSLFFGKQKVISLHWLN